MDVSHMILSLSLVVIVSATSTVDETVIPGRCFEPPETGNCRAKFRMWFHNASSNACEQFIYGGCPGSDNKFSTREECMSTCQPSACFEPAVTGPCIANIRLWYYDSTHHQCKQFTYGGCQGNENRFGTEHSCHIACGESNEVCSLSNKFESMGRKPVNVDYMADEFFLYYCEKRCRDWCREPHAWGHCLSFSVERTWYGCYCYVFNRYLSDGELDRTTQGQSWNRLCQGE